MALRDGCLATQCIIRTLSDSVYITSLSSSIESDALVYRIILKSVVEIPSHKGQMPNIITEQCPGCLCPELWPRDGHL